MVRQLLLTNHNLPLRKVSFKPRYCAMAHVVTARHLVAWIGWLASGAGRCRTTAPSLTLGSLPCRSKPRQPVPPHSEAAAPEDPGAGSAGILGPAAGAFCRAQAHAR